MRLKDNGTAITVWISADETRAWARGNGAGQGCWPCSELEGRRLRADFDSSGLLDYTIDGLDGLEQRRRGLWVPADEWNAVIADHLRTRLPQSHPCYFVAVGQFEGVQS